MSEASRRLLWALIALGSLVRLYVAFATRGSSFDISSYELARDALNSHPLQLYGLVNVPFAPHWPYPPAFFPWILVSDLASNASGLRFDGFIQVAPIAADAAIAWIVQAFLGQRGADDRTRVTAAALVALGPTFATISGYHGQIDSVCILPAIIGFWVWMRSERSDRALLAGLLIGLAIAVKQPAGLVLLALLPSARSGREMVNLCATAAAVPILMLLPFLAGHFSQTIDGLTANNGLPGVGGISLVVQPDLAEDWLHTGFITFSGASQFLYDYGTLFALATLLATTAVLYRRRTPPQAAALIVWLTFYAFGIDFSISYLVLGMPFFLMMGRTREVAAIQAATIIPMLIFYTEGGRDLPLLEIYAPIMIALWAAFLAWWIAEMWRLPSPSPP